MKSCSFSLFFFLFFFVSQFSPFLSLFCFSLLSLYSFLFFLYFFFSFSLSVFCSFYCLFFFSLSFPFSVPFFSAPPSVFIGKTKGGKTPYHPCPRGTWRGRPLCSRSELPKGYIPLLLPPCGKQVGMLCWRLFKV